MSNNNVAIKALVKAQTEMGKALKDSKNPHFKSSYADLSSVMSAVMPALNTNGFAMMQIDGQDDRGKFVQTKFIHESGEEFASTVYLTIGKPDMQGYGSAQTYARRYGLMGLAGIAPEDDDGNEAAKTPKPADKPQESKPPTKDEIDGAIKWLNESPDTKVLGERKASLKQNRPHVWDKSPAVREAATARENELVTSDEIPY